jgi:hypothetical protein
MTVAVTGGCREKWIEWDGRIGEGVDAGTVTLDGRQVPVWATVCDVDHHGGLEEHYEFVARGELCRPTPTRGPFAGEQMEAVGFGWWAPLENGLWVETLVGNEDSMVLVWEAFDGDYAVRVLADEGVAERRWECVEGWRECRGCEHWTAQYGFESYGEYMGILRSLGGLTVRRKPELVAAAVRPAGRPEDRVQKVRRVGTVTREEYMRGLRP